jgi:long-subunit fatty acid transport protein
MLMKRCRTALVVLAATVAASAARPAAAAAYYVGEFHARSVARGGANLVNPKDPSAVWSNPAALSNAKGLQLQLDLNLVQLSSRFVRDCGGVANGCAPLSDYSRDYGDGRAYSIVGNSRVLGENTTAAEPNVLGTPGTPSYFDGQTTAVENNAFLQPIPRMILSLNLDTFGLDGFAVGAFVLAPSSGAYDFAGDAPTRYSLIKRQLLEVYYGVTAAYRFQNWIAIGASLQGVTAGVDQSIKLAGDLYGNEDPTGDVEVQITGTKHFIPSAAFGLWSNPLQGLGIGDIEIGLSMQLPRTVSAQGALKVNSIGQSLQDIGVQINADNATATSEFTLPAFYRAGVKYNNDNLTGDDAKTVSLDVEADFVYEQWSMYDHVYVKPENVTFSIGGAAPQGLAPIVQPKDWQDSWSARLGGTVGLWDKMLELHLGGFYETAAIPNETYSIELVDSQKIGVGTGVSGTWNGIRLDVAYGHVFYQDRKIGQESQVYSGVASQAFGEGRTRVAMGQYSASLNMLNVGLTVAFDSLFGFGQARTQ